MAKRPGIRRIEFRSSTIEAREAPIERILRPYERRLRDLRHRWIALNDFIGELHAASRGRRFEIHNQAVWDWMTDARDMFVIHFGAWAKLLWSSGGLIGQLTANPPLLRQPGKAKRRSDRVGRFRMETFTRLFPDASTQPQPNDVERLKSMLERELGRVVTDRDDNRAHPPLSGEVPNIEAFHGHGDLDAHLKFAEGFLNDLRICAGVAVLDIGPPPDSVTVVSQELVDAILIRGAHFVAHVERADLVAGTQFTWQRRERIYQALHDASTGRPPDEPFNADADLNALLSN